MPQVPKAESKGKKKKIVLIIVAILVLLAIGGGAWWWFAVQNKPQTPAEKVNTGLQQSQDAYSKGDYTGALIAVNDLDKQAASNSEKAQVYQAAAQAAQGAGQLDQAAQYYQQKHQADPTTTDADAYNLGVIYMQLGQNDKALEQFKIALAYAQGHPSQYGSDAPGIQATIDQLEGK